ncbi:MAG: hypothetical protein ACE5OZ_07085 [Candidatus Heimdallarchaeota archaeon]
MARISISKEVDDKLTLLKVVFNTKDTSEIVRRLIEYWEKDHGELKVPVKSSK